MKNLDIRKEISDADLKLWQVADGMGFTDSTFSRKLRHELPDEKKAQIRAVIAQLSNGGAQHGE